MRTRLSPRLRKALKLSTLISTGASILLGIAAISVAPRQAQALPSYARQTGQSCGACHTDFPQLTPFGRRFKLGGYTLGGGENTEAYKKTFGSDKWVPPISVMGIPAFTNTNSALSPGDIPPGFKSNDNLALQQASVFYGGRITDNIGAFVQGTYDGVAKQFMWDNADIRYAKSTTVSGTDVLFGITAHNSPTVQDVWNTTPAWRFPFISSSIAPSPAASTMIEGAFAAQVGGVGAYAFIKDFLYFEVSGYRTLPSRALSTLGIDPAGTSAISGVAPYWRVAAEPSWGSHSLQIGAFGMIADVVPQRMPGFGTDKVSDIGIDSQYQYMADNFSFTARTSYITENQRLTASKALGLADNMSNTLNSFRTSATFVYGRDERVALTGGRFKINGSADVTLYGTANGSPNSGGWIAEVAFIPFGMNSPSVWPWFNARIGLQYIWYDKFNGASTNYDGNGRNARDNNTLFLYAWLAM
jgi:hypothetical protein